MNRLNISIANFLRTFQPFLILLLISVFLLPAPLLSKNYYIDAASQISDDGNTGTNEKPWKTIGKANKIVTHGDTVYIKAGVYKEAIKPVNSGESTDPIVYMNYNQDSVTITDTDYGIHLDKKNYIAVSGLHFYKLDSFLWIENSSMHNSIIRCTFDQGRTIGWSGSKIYYSSSFNRIIKCRFSKYGKFTDDDIGCLLDIGNEESTTDMSGNNLIDSCEIFHGGHHLLGVYGMNNVIRGCSFHNEVWQNGFGDRNVYFAGYPENSGRNLFENNRIGYSGIPPDNWGASGTSLTTAGNIVRRNIFFNNNLSGISMTLSDTYYSDIINNKIYHNTFFHNGFNMATGADALTSAIGFAIYSGKHVIKNNIVQNNCFYRHYQPFGFYEASKADQIFINNWDGDKQGNPLFSKADTLLGDPFNYTYPDLQLKKGSPCIDSGTFLTTITSAAGTGTTFNVDNAGYFTDGWGIDGVEGDMIQLFGSTQRARIKKIDYEKNTITIDASLTWTTNQGICLVYEGNAPDIGAYESMSSITKTNQNLDLIHGYASEEKIQIKENSDNVRLFDFRGRSCKVPPGKIAKYKASSGVYLLLNNKDSKSPKIIFLGKR